jgi:hypothetical protein
MGVEPTPETPDAARLRLLRLHDRIPKCTVTTHPYPVFTDPPHPDTHPWIAGVLSVGSRSVQCTAFRLITGHAFHATYSRRFRPGAPDILSCPDRNCDGVDWTPQNYFDDGCHKDEVIKGELIPYDTFDTLPQTESGGRKLARVLARTGAFACPLPVPRPDPP